MSENTYTGSSFDDFLKEEGIYEECTDTALKRVLAWLVEQEMERQNITKPAMADRMHSSMSQLDTLLNPEITGIALATLQRAAKAVGRVLRVELV
jgi:antitoxin HicB